jgi:cell division protein FtsB
MLRAREEAIRSVLLAERHRAELRARTGQNGLTNGEAASEIDATEVPTVSPDVLIEHLRRENDELKDTVDSLRQEVQRLRAANKR